MTPEQIETFFQTFEKLIDNADVLTSTEFRTGVLLLAVAMQDSGYANFSHEEAGIICGTDKNATMRAHLIHLRSAGVLSDYSTNGTVRIQFSGYAGKRMIVHRRGELLAEPTKSLSEPTKSRAQPTVDGASEDKRALSQLLRALRSRDRALSQHPSRNFDDYPQSSPSMLLLLNNNNITADQTGNKQQQQPTANDPEAHAIAFLLLKNVGMWANVANPLVNEFPLTHIRRAVCEFAMNPSKYRSAKIIDTWLRQGAPLAEISEQFRQSELHLKHRTKQEIAEDAAELAARLNEEENAAPITFSSITEIEPETEWQRQDDLWQRTYTALDLPTIVKSTWLATATLWRSQNDGVYCLGLPAHALTNVQERLRPVLRRTLAAQCNISVSAIELTIIAQEEETA